MVLRTNFKAFKVVSSEKNFFQKFEIFWLFCISGSQISCKMTNFFFERYGPEIFCGLHKWCCETILRRFRSFRAKKNFSKVASFLTFFAYPVSQISWKMTNFFFERNRPEICRGLHKWCSKRILRRFRLFQAKKIFLKIRDFLTFCISGVTDFLKNDQLLFWEIPAWNLSWTAQSCCEQILRHLRLFRAKKKFFKSWKFFDFFAYLGSQISSKMTNFFFERYRPEIFCGLQKWCCERIIRRFGSFRVKKIFFKNLKFFDFFCISGVTDFLKNDQLLFWEIPAWNFFVDCTNGVANEL